MAKAQASSELITIMGISLLVVLLFSILASKSISDITAGQNYNDARDSAKALAQAADSVYAQGEGASKSVFIKIPANTLFGPNYTFIGKPANAPDSAQANAIGINVDGVDEIAQSAAPLSGTLPSSPGSYMMKVVSHGSYVHIAPYLVDLDQYSVFVSMASNESRQAVVKIYSSTNSTTVRADANASWGYADVNLSISPQSLNASPAGSAFTLTFSSALNSSGTHNSQLTINASTASGANETFYLPISVYVHPGAPVIIVTPPASPCGTLPPGMKCCDFGGGITQICYASHGCDAFDLGCEWMVSDGCNGPGDPLGC